MPTVKVELGKRSYPIIIGDRLEEKLQSLLRKAVGKGKLFVFFDAQFHALHGDKLEKQIRSACGNIEILLLPRGERGKSASTVGKIHDFLLSEKISRSDLILACGGGITTDLAGYAAATVLRGVRWAALSTTLLGMVDAAIGGKTGVNHRLGKNLIGAIWQPEFVLCDLYYLNTLPKRQILAGLGEVVKYGALVGEPMIADLERLLKSGDMLDKKVLPRLVLKSAQYKAQLVAEDERDSGKRMFLNLGHTFGHAIEHSLGYGRLLHGEAVL
ncbi:MAG: 3-dehydroquinate synthase family protein, partial [candidate division Zixibacteria bacterium]